MNKHMTSFRVQKKYEKKHIDGFIYTDLLIQERSFCIPYISQNSILLNSEV
jgi:hypothetical protein